MLNTLIVVDDGALLSDTGLGDISFQQYLSDYPKKDERKTRVINLRDTATYLSRGYYCSLLSEARQHKVLPSVNTINDLRDASDVTAFDVGLTALIVDSEDIAEGLEKTGPACLRALPVADPDGGIGPRPRWCPVGDQECLFQPA